MSYGSALQRRLDTDKIELIEASGPQGGKPAAAKAASKKQGRPSGSYRCARRNEARSLGRKAGVRARMLTYADLLRINAIAARNAHIKAHEDARATVEANNAAFAPLGPKEHELAQAGA